MFTPMISAAVSRISRKNIEISHFFIRLLLGVIVGFAGPDRVCRCHQNRKIGFGIVIKTENNFSHRGTESTERGIKGVFSVSSVSL